MEAKRLILTPDQAEAAYEAMCDLGVLALSSRIEFPTRAGWKLVVTYSPGRVVVENTAPDAIRNERESYDTRIGFAIAYGLRMAELLPARA